MCVGASFIEKFLWCFTLHSHTTLTDCYPSVRGMEYTGSCIFMSVLDCVRLIGKDDIPIIGLLIDKDDIMPVVACEQNPSASYVRLRLDGWKALETKPLGGRESEEGALWEGGVQPRCESRGGSNFGAEQASWGGGGS